MPVKVLVCECVFGSLHMAECYSIVEWQAANGRTRRNLNLARIVLLIEADKQWFQEKYNN